MGKAPDELTPRPDSPNHVQGEQELEEISEEIEHTRAELSETIDAIQARLAPQHLVEQARGAARDASASLVEETKSALREATLGRAEQFVGKAGRKVNEFEYSARGASNSMMDTIRQNPIPAAMAAIGIGWLLSRRKSGHMAHTHSPDSWMFSEHAYEDHGRFHQRNEQGIRDRFGEAQHRATGMVGGAKGAVGDIAGSATNLASEATDRASHTVGQIADRARGQIGGLSSGAQVQFESMREESPLALGAIAFGLGAAIGMMIPPTPREREMLGGVSETIMERTQEVAQTAQERLLHVTEHMNETAKEELQTAEKELREPESKAS